nr:MAG TPA_asm: hypothetical protein [Caudoviricetes sp.]
MPFLFSRLKTKPRELMHSKGSLFSCLNFGLFDLLAGPKEQVRSI